jgi:glutamate decarboxylase
VVCRNGFSEDLADLFIDDVRRSLEDLRRQPHPLTHDRGAATGFHH